MASHVAATELLERERELEVLDATLARLRRASARRS